MTSYEMLIFVIVLIIMLIGLVGVILPILPGVPLIFGAALVYAILTGFKEIHLNLILIFAGMTIFSLVIDYLARYVSVKKMGGGTAGAIGAVVGMMIAIFFGLIWIIVLPFVLAVVFELTAGKGGQKALKAGVGTFVGLLFSVLLDFIIGCIMVGIFVWAVLL